jgi:hypothetical protein
MTAVEKTQNRPIEALRSGVEDLDFLLRLLDIAWAGLKTTCLFLNVKAQA